MKKTDELEALIATEAENPENNVANNKVHKAIFRKGFLAALEGEPKGKCPYEDSGFINCWESGWRVGREHVRTRVEELITRLEEMHKSKNNPNPKNIYFW